MSEDTGMEGVTKWFDEAKGYGFIKVPNEERDVFVHAKQLRLSGIENGIEEGDKLAFIPALGVKGKYATKIKRVG